MNINISKGDINEHLRLQRNCWRCRHNTQSNMCTVVNDGDGAEVDAVREWIDEHVSDENGMMPAQETPTACPGFSEVPHE